MAISDFQGYDVSVGESLQRAFKPIWISLVETTLNYHVTIVYILYKALQT